MDTRAQSICDRLNEEIGQTRSLRLQEIPFSHPIQLQRSSGIRENLPEVYAKIYKILQSNSYIAYKLTGVMTQDVSQGYGLHCFDMRTGSWDEEMCQESWIPIGFLPEILPVIK